MNAQAQMEARKLEAFRPYLRMVARLHWDARLRGKLDPEDLVQQTLLEAHRSLGQFRGETDAELAGWLTQILAHQLAHAVRYYTQAMRDLGQEVPLEDEAEASSAPLERWLAADHSSPSERAHRNECAVRLAAALEHLPGAQREAVELRHLHGWTVAAIARRLNRSTPAVAGLLQRGLRQLRLSLSELE